MEIQIRAGKAEDRNFIISTWLKGQLFGEPFFAGVPKEVFFDRYAPQIEHILANPATEVAVACLPEDPDIILGYIVFKQHCLAWAFTKAAWRGQGILNKLTQGRGLSVVSSMTRPGRAISLKKHWQWNPWAI